MTHHHDTGCLSIVPIQYNQSPLITTSVPVPHIRYHHHRSFDRDRVLCHRPNPPHTDPRYYGNGCQGNEGIGVLTCRLEYLLRVSCGHEILPRTLTHPSPSVYHDLLIINISSTHYINYHSSYYPPTLPHNSFHQLICTILHHKTHLV